MVLLESTFDIEGVKNLFFQVAGLLGLAILVYLYINFKSNNRKKEVRKRRLDIKGAMPGNDSYSNDNELMELIPIPIVATSRKGRVCQCNIYFKSIITSSYKNIEGRTIADLFTGEAYDMLKLIFEKDKLPNTELIILVKGTNFKVNYEYYNGIDNAELLISFVPVR